MGQQAVYPIVKRVMMALGVASVIAITAIAFMAPISHAAEEKESITLSPANKFYQLDAGKSAESTLTIINDGTVGYNFIVYARPYFVKNENYEPDFNAAKPNTDAYSWVRFEKTSYHLEPGQTVKVPYTITVPSTAAPGGHYGVIFAQTQPTETAEGNSVIRKKRVGSIVYATVNGDYIKEGKVERTDVPFWQLQPPLHAESLVKNTGNTDFVDETQLTVKDIFGKVKYVSKQEFAVLPGTTRKINFDWEKSNWFGFYKVEVQHKFLGKTTDSHSYVLMMPRFLPIALLVVVLIGGAYAWFRRRQH